MLKQINIKKVKGFPSFSLPSLLVGTGWRRKRGAPPGKEREHYCHFGGIVADLAIIAILVALLLMLPLLPFWWHHRCSGCCSSFWSDLVSLLPLLPMLLLMLLVPLLLLMLLLPLFHFLVRLACNIMAIGKCQRKIAARPVLLSSAIYNSTQFHFLFKPLQWPLRILSPP